MIDMLVGGQRKEIPNSLRKKLEAKKHNEEHVNYTLDPEYFNWDAKCKTCHGKGITAMNKLTNGVIYCKCVRVTKVAIKDVPEKKDAIAT